METRQLGALWPVSELTLGGGGLGQLWGETSREEAAATVKLAVDQGITLLDLAPLYGRGESEMVVGEAFGGKLPGGVRVTTKCLLGTLPAGDVHPKFEQSLTRSLEALKLERVDLFFLHSQICPDDYTFEEHADTQDRWATRWSCYTDGVIPAMEKLKTQGLIGDWGLTGTGLPKCIMDALRADEKPAAVQAITNLMDSPGGIRMYEEPAEPRNIIRTAKNNDVGVLGIRAVQAGALTNKIDRDLPADHPEVKDYEKAKPFRDFCKGLGADPAVLAHRYALQMEGVDTVILGVKNRQELQQLIDAANQGPLDPDIVAKIDALGLARQIPKIPLEAEL